VPWKVKDPRISQVTGLPKGGLGREVVLGYIDCSENVKAEIREAYPEFMWYFKSREAEWMPEEREVTPTGNGLRPYPNTDITELYRWSSPPSAPPSTTNTQGTHGTSTQTKPSIDPHPPSDQATTSKPLTKTAPDTCATSSACNTAHHTGTLTPWTRAPTTHLSFLRMSRCPGKSRTHAWAKELGYRRIE
jgi:hypothetical protein